MDSNIVLDLAMHDEPKALTLDVLDYKTGEELAAAIYAHFGERARFVEADGAPTIPDELLPPQIVADWDNVIDYCCSAEKLEDDELDAFKAYFIARGSHGKAEEAREEFKRTYQGEHNTLAEYGASVADDLDLPEWAKNAFDEEKFGRELLQDGYCLEDRYYFKN